MAGVHVLEWGERGITVLRKVREEVRVAVLILCLDRIFENEGRRR